MEEGKIDELFDSLNPSTSNTESYKLELKKIRKSRTFQLSTIFVKAFEKPWKLPFIPLSIVVLFLKSLFNNTNRIVLEESRFTINNNQDKKDCVVFFPTDEDGFEHFSRSLAVAQKVKQSSPKMEILFFTTLSSLNIIQDSGFPAYHLPNRKSFKDMPTSVWNSILQENLELTLHNHNPKVFVFDGNYQHLGMLKALARTSGILTIEINRESKHNLDINEHKGFKNQFEVLVKPGVSFDEKQENSPNNVSVVYTDPILLPEFESSPPSREEIRSQLGIPKSVTVVFLQNTEDGYKLAKNEMSFILDALSLVNIWIVVGESIVGSRYENTNSRVRVIRDYPLTRYYHAFDFTIMAGNFDTFHTSIHNSLPAICIPVIGIESESREKRIKNAVDAGFMLAIDGFSKKQLSEAIEKLIDNDKRQSMWDSVIHLHKPNGADQISGFILENL